MRIKTLIKPLVLTLSLAIALSLVSVYPLLSVACAAAPSTHLNLAVARSAAPMPAVTNDSVFVWNQHAVALTLLPANALSPVQQTRVMAIFHLAVHDAVNGITGEYETYLSPPSPPANASAEAAAIGAAHQALKTLFPGNDLSLDNHFANVIRQVEQFVNCSTTTITGVVTRIAANVHIKRPAGVLFGTQT